MILNSQKRSNKKEVEVIVKRTFKTGMFLRCLLDEIIQYVSILSITDNQKCQKSNTYFNIKIAIELSQ